MLGVAVHAISCTFTQRVKVIFCQYLFHAILFENSESEISALFHANSFTVAQTVNVTSAGHTFLKVEVIVQQVTFTSQ